MARAEKTKKYTRIQQEKREVIFAAALDVFSEKGLRGATLDEIAKAAKLSKQNVIYYFAGKDEIYAQLLEGLLEVWVSPLRDLSADGEPLDEILSYVRRKLQMSKDMPRESRLFATEILHGAPRTRESLRGGLKALVDEKVRIISGWIDDGKIAPVDPYHLIFSIWSMTQHYADFDIQIKEILDHKKADSRFEDAEAYLTTVLTKTLQP